MRFASSRFYSGGSRTRSLEISGRHRNERARTWLAIRTLIAALLLVVPVAPLAALPAKRQDHKLEKQYRRARKHFDSRDYDGVRRELEPVLQANPDFEQARILLALTLAMQSQLLAKAGKPADAIRALREALRLDPDEPYWHSALAGLLEKQGDAENAVKECEQAEDLSPLDAGLASGCGLKSMAPPEEESAEGDEQRPGSAHGIKKVTGDVSAPRPRFYPEPHYSKKARMIEYSGAMVLSIVVNAEGNVEKVSVERSLGLGLDEEALKTIRTWKFVPAMRGTRPVPVRVRIETNFRI